MATSIPSNSTTLFYQSSAPVGWTKLTTFNDFGLRLTSGTTSDVTTSQPFSTVHNLVSVVFTGLTASPTTPASVATVNPATTTVGTHNHPFAYTTRSVYNTTAYAASAYPGRVTSPFISVLGAVFLNPTTQQTGSAGSGGTHTHPITIETSLTVGGVPGSTSYTVSQNLLVNYIDIILATRN
jgi:hypothetical protein